MGVLSYRRCQSVWEPGAPHRFLWSCKISEVVPWTLSHPSQALTVVHASVHAATGIWSPKTSRSGPSNSPKKKNKGKILSGISRSPERHASLKRSATWVRNKTETYCRQLWSPPQHTSDFSRSAHVRPPTTTQTARMDETRPHTQREQAPQGTVHLDKEQYATILVASCLPQSPRRGDYPTHPVRYAIRLSRPSTLNKL